MMAMIEYRRWASWLSLCLLCVACAPLPTVPPAPPQTLLQAAEAELPAYALLAAELQGLPGGRLFRLDPAASQVRIHVFRAGRAAALGHNHVLAAPRLQGLLWWPWEQTVDEEEAAGPRLAARGAGRARFALGLRLDELELDAPALRAELGPGWASRLSPEAVAATRANMLGESGLQAARYPELRIQGLQLIGEAPRLVAVWALSLHGQTRRFTVPLRLRIDEQGVSIEGAWVLRQSDFGLQPFSVAGGLLAVQDELLLEFKLQGR